MVIGGYWWFSPQKFCLKTCLCHRKLITWLPRTTIALGYEIKCDFICISLVFFVPLHHESDVQIRVGRSRGREQQHPAPLAWREPSEVGEAGRKAPSAVAATKGCSMDLPAVRDWLIHNSIASPRQQRLHGYNGYKCNQRQMRRSVFFYISPIT